MPVHCAFIFHVTAILSCTTYFGEAAIPPFKEQCLKWHNEFRKRHQVEPVTWSDDLTKGAKSWADILARNRTFKHAKGIAPGENLYLSGKPLPEEICTEATTLFYEEVKKYDFNKPGFSTATGHFTQLVWKKTKQIGAAQAPRSDGRVVVVVRYSPAGNYVGKYKENVLPELSGAGQTRFSFVLVGFVVIIGAAFSTFF